MKNHLTRLPRQLFAPLIISACLSSCMNPVKPASPMDRFFAKMVAARQFNETELKALFANVAIKDDILKKMAKPAEGLPWHRYRKIFITDKRIADGVKFWDENAQTLADVERRYGVPAGIIVAILGVETAYGQHPGKYRVLDALSTLAFAYPPRSEFFLSELEQFLLLCREERINPLEPVGSYAGAMGTPQFMPSSFRRYATDFNKDGRRDIWHGNADVIASVANYFAQFHWQTGQAIAAPVIAKGEEYKAIMTGNLKPDLRLAELESLNLKISQPLALADKVKILELKQEQGEELWAVTDNFYCLTRYNHSPLYAMAVYQLSESILNNRGHSHEQTHNSNALSDGMQFF
ncbi:lytic murein transglycosylase B [Methylovulum miyakonense]|uniref:lytic murein transglycosylase B n=1 Tax=Methylovulum miyakonense TaxID=645578 RepID=UPI0006890F81|nr:lytic murein transglycosylase B [Methylovulum miyakonense]